MNPKTQKLMGWIGTGTSMLMYIAYFPQIAHNLSGRPGNPIQPLVAAINCTLWVSYGFFQKEEGLAADRRQFTGNYFRHHHVYHGNPLTLY